MNTQPLRYQSLKVVLLYMEANVRNKISQRLSTIRSTEKIVPLRIRHLGLERYIFEVGDVPLKELNDEPFRHDTDEIEEREKGSLRNYEAALALKIKSMDTEATVEEIPENNNQDIADNARIRRLSNYSIERLHEGIAFHRHALLPFHYRRHNLSPPYTCYIQLTAASKGTKPRIQRYKYTKSLYEAAKQLNTILFGGRKGVIQVRDFQMPWYSILRLPVGFKIRIKCMDNVYDLSLKYNAMLSMIDSSSFPLDKANIYSIIDAGVGVNDLRLPAIRSAKMLKIHYISIEPVLLPLLRTVPNQTVIVTYSDVSYPADEYFALVRSWFNDKRPVGTCYLFPLREEETAREILKLIKIRMENTKRTKRRVTVCMGHSNRLEVYYVPADTHSDPEFKCHGYKWILNMRVVHV
ncbi:hypothetical protein GCK72_007341 [Caenorhabditis remanei]|uniref:Uncharacterized protein n=1 Tax=Caenorhabditis remanei TaxID=31234 RepID=A0A6A5HNL8_CAERE|nr:hypothetical protein GCK72_007341 [Caenorhabditis remanei]KAF1767382.1 hypothetical protein GCK72_007341 [Caenorhabditis remanei]